LLEKLEQIIFEKELFYKNFIDWLTNTTPDSFREINGHNILNSFLIDIYGFKQPLSIVDYRWFIIENNELIEYIKKWVLTFELEPNEYYELFRHYLKNSIFDLNQNMRYFFNNVIRSFRKEIISPSYVVDNLEIDLVLLKEIFESEKRSFLKNKQRIAYENRDARELKIKIQKREQRRRYKKKRFKNDIEFRILHRLRTRMLLVLKGQKKLKSSMNLLGCSPEYLKEHLESKFKPGMSWGNYGIKGWHIDHIKPCASFVDKPFQVVPLIPEQVVPLIPELLCHKTKM